MACELVLFSLKRRRKHKLSGNNAELTPESLSSEIARFAGDFGSVTDFCDLSLLRAGLDLVWSYISASRSVSETVNMIDLRLFTLTYNPYNKICVNCGFNKHSSALNFIILL